MAHSEHPTNTIQTGHPQAQALRSPRLHRRIPSDTSRPCVMRLHSILSSTNALQCIEAFEYCQQAISNCQDLYFLEDTVTPILKTDASDYGVGGYLYSVINGKVRVIRFFSKALVGAQLNWSARKTECYGIYFGVKTFEDLLDNRYFISISL